MSKLTDCGASLRLLTGTALAAFLVLSPVAANASASSHNRNDATSEKVPEGDLVTEEVAMVRGETISLLLRRKGVVEADRMAALQALGDMPDLHTLQKGQKVALVLRPTGALNGATRLVSMRLQTAHDREVTIAAGSEFEQHIDETLTDWTVKLVTRKGTVGDSLVKGLDLAGVPKPVQGDVATAARLDPTLPKKLPADTAFTVVYKAQFKEEGKKTLYELSYAGFQIGAKEHLIYRYQLPAGLVAFLTPEGTGKASLAMANPLPGAPITSPHGWRVHPIYHVRKFHRGIDLGAPVGTPIYAPADGVVVEKAWHTGYGRRLVLSHGGGVTTGFSHLSRYGSTPVGGTVKKGDVIAYVGRSGKVTGPHLDYEVIRDGKYLDPLKASITQSVALKGADLEAFREFVAATAEDGLDTTPLVEEDLAPGDKAAQSLNLTLKADES